MKWNLGVSNLLLLIKNFAYEHFSDYKSLLTFLN